MMNRFEGKHSVSCKAISLVMPIICLLFGCESQASRSIYHEALGPQGRSLGDAACGPRCINHVLEYYGEKKVFLPKLMKDLGVSQKLGGVPFDRLKLILENYGIYAEFARLGPYDVLIWDDPVILHHGNHFFTHIRNVSDSTIVLHGIESGTFSSYADMLDNVSRVVLLTSDTPVTSSAQFAEFRPLDKFLVCCFIASAACFLALLNSCWSS